MFTPQQRIGLNEKNVRYQIIGVIPIGAVDVNTSGLKLVRAWRNATSQSGSNRQVRWPKSILIVR